MKTLVVPVDFSSDSVKAVQRAISMAPVLDADVHLIHVNKVKNVLFGGKGTEDPQEISRSFESLLNTVPHNGVTLNPVVRTGKVMREIVKYAEEVDAFMIIMGTHGTSGFEEFWAGSNAYKVASHAHCPVMTLRGEDSHDAIKRIVLPIDVTASTRQKVPFTLELAKIFNSEVHVIAVYMDDTQEFMNRINNYTAQVRHRLEEEDIDVVVDFLHGNNITNLSIDYAKKVDADLIVIMTEQETSFINTFMGPYAQQMVNHSPVPVLTMHRNVNIEGNVSIM